MGPAGAVAVAALAAVIAAVGAALAAFAFRGMLHASSEPSRWARALLPAGVLVLALGVILPKSVQRAVEFESSGRIVMVLAALVGLVASVAALVRREPGALRALLCHLYFAALAGSPVGEVVFGVFRML